MNKEQKDLLLKDLCARLPYGVKFACNKNIYTAKGLDLIVTDEGGWEYAVTAKGIAPIEIDFIKPYLFPMSSMTEEQDKEFALLQTSPGQEGFIYIWNCAAMIKWLIENHFDYNGLIPKGLANDATNKNIY